MKEFHGAKLAILSRNRIVTILRDDRVDIPWPNHWDLPGGGREGFETPEACVLRETREELGLILSPSDLHWCASHRARPGRTVWFFVSEQPDFRPEAVRFGNEGQEWRLARIDWFLGRNNAIDHHKLQLRAYLQDRIP